MIEIKEITYAQTNRNFIISKTWFHINICSCFLDDRLPMLINNTEYYYQFKVTYLKNRTRNISITKPLSNIIYLISSSNTPHGFEVY